MRKESNHQNYFDKCERAGISTFINKPAAKEVFEFCFKEYHTGTSLVKAYNSQKSQGNNSLVRGYFKVLHNLGYLEQSYRKDIQRKKAYRLNIKPFLDYFKQKYDYDPSDKTLNFLKMLLNSDEQRRSIIQGIELQDSNLKHKFKWRPDSDKHVLDTFRDYLRYYLLHEGVILALDDPKAYYHQIVNQNKKIWSMFGEYIEQAERLLEPDIFDMMADLGDIPLYIHKNPEAFTELVFGLFNTFADRHTFQIMLAYELNKPDKKQRPVTKKIHSEIKVEDRFT